MTLTTRENPANRAATSAGKRDRIPMALPVMRLEVPPIPGYHIHWFNGDEPARIRRALAAGYEFVDKGEVQLNRPGLGNGNEVSGSDDLGTKISIEGLILMKLPQEYWDDDITAYEADQEIRLSALRTPTGVVDPKQGHDASHRYSHNEQAHAFTLQRRVPAKAARSV